MSTSDSFLKFINQLVHQHAERQNLHPQEALELQTMILDIFEENYDLDQIHLEVMELLGSRESFRGILPEIEEHFNAN